MSDNAPTIDAWSYRPGTWFAVFGPEAAIVLPESQRDQMIGLWALVDGGAGFDEVLDGLLASGLSRIPGFVLISTGADSTRILLRGDGVVATVTASGESVTLDGAASHTWVERSLDDVTELSVALPVEAGSAEDETDFAIRTGLVKVGRIDRAGAAQGAHRGDATDLATVLPLSEPSPLDESGAVEPHPLDDAASAVTDATHLDEDPATEFMDAVDDTPLAPPTSEPDGWITPTDVPSPAPVLGDPNIPPPPSAPPSFESVPGPPGWVPPPPPIPAPPVPVPPVPAPPASIPTPPDATDTGDMPPLTVGSWEPVTGLAAGSAPGIDHDGQTILGEPQAPEPLVAPVPGTPDVPAVTPPVAKLLISDGQEVVVDRAVLIGRAPETRRFGSTEHPTLITVPSRLHEISSTHIEVRPGSGADLGSAVVTDMGSTNGTVLVQPELGPEDLKPGVPVQLIPGATINLGDGVTIQVVRP